MSGRFSKRYAYNEGHARGMIGRDGPRNSAWATLALTMVPLSLPPRVSTVGVRRGDVIAGKYRVERLLGRGGMGIVVAATHLHLGERVAVKLLLPGSAVTPGALARFLREGRAAARLRSEHVARVYDAGLTDSGEPYLVLEYLEGEDLRTRVKEGGPLGVGLAVELLLGVCEGLAEAHARGVVHRDLKPANLFLARRPDGSRVVKIIDFGISKIASQEAPEGTLTGSAMGTPNYMAPEQMRCARAVDARADIWSLGATLFGLLTGGSPFPGESMIEVYDRVLGGAPSLRAACPEAPPELASIVDRCLQIDPAERFGDVGELAVALSQLVPEDLRAPARRAVVTLRSPPPEPLSSSEDAGDVESRSLSWPATTGALGAEEADSADSTAQPVTQDALEPSWGAGGVGAASFGGRRGAALSDSVSSEADPPRASDVADSEAGSPALFDDGPSGGPAGPRSPGGGRARTLSPIGDLARRTKKARGAPYEVGARSDQPDSEEPQDPEDAAGRPDSATGDLPTGLARRGTDRIRNQAWTRRAMLAAISLAGAALIGIAATRDLGRATPPSEASSPVLAAPPKTAPGASGAALRAPSVSMGPQAAPNPGALRAPDTALPEAPSSAPRLPPAPRSPAPSAETGRPTEALPAGTFVAPPVKQALSPSPAKTAAPPGRAPSTTPTGAPRAPAGASATANRPLPDLSDTPD